MNTISPGSIISPTSPVGTCRPHIERIVREIRTPEVREVINSVFEDLLRLLECLSLIESHLRTIEAADETFELFQLIRDDASALVSFIRDEALDQAVMGEELFDTLDGIAFAVNHDLLRVFDPVPKAPSDSNDAHVVVGRLFRSHDILTNCLQQSAITLAMVFDSRLVGAKLFNNSDLRRRQSLQLCEDISALALHVEKSEADKDEATLAALTLGIELFRGNTMELLRYSDWPQFESFCEKILLSLTDWSQLEPVLHQFRCYLETLLGQVKRRAVLSSEFPPQFGNGNMDPFAGEFSDSEDEENWNLLPIAV